jgi:lipopolysaccharide biosynthesis glycosyltransferase
MNIAIVFSPDWSRYVAIELLSIFSTNPAPIKVYLISDGPPLMDFQCLCRPGCEVQYIDLEQRFKERIPSIVNVCTRFTKYVLYRLLLPEIINDDRLLYLDADVIVNGDITGFYNTDMGDNLVAGVQDTGMGCGNLTAWHQRLQSIGLSPGARYINAGVTLFNMAAVRKSGLQETWIRMANEMAYACHDQDIINLTCQGRIQLINLPYNVSLSTGLDINQDDIRIMHYAGQKPWANSDAPFQAIWKRWADKYDAETPKIPKKIHYCWFGGWPKPPIIQRCMESWQRVLPGYEIVEWNESNFDLSRYPYAKAAYDSGKFAFVTDVVRLWALYHYGGIYLDGDVEILQPLDRFLRHRAFTGHEIDDLWLTAVLGAEPGHPWIEKLLRYYETAPFDCVPNTQVVTKLSRPLLEREVYGFKYLQGGVVIYPIDTFCGYNHQELRPIVTENSYATHWFAGSWLGRMAV